MRARVREYYSGRQWLRYRGLVRLELDPGRWHESKKGDTVTKSQEHPDPTGFASTSPASLEDAVYTGAERRHVPRALPVPEVVETDDADAWAMWHQSVTQIDSQLPTQPAPLEGWPAPDESDSQGTETADPNDPFASVHRRSR